MRVSVFLVVFSIIFCMLAQNLTLAQSEVAKSNVAKSNVAKSNVAKTVMKISSQAFENKGKIPKKYTCDGASISPPLKIANVPKNAKSLALILDDPGAPKGTFTHWIVWGMSPKKTKIAENEKKGFVEGSTSLGKPGYVGLCPPYGTHTYLFKLYALDLPVNISAKAGKQELTAKMQGHIIQIATLTGKYSR